MLSHSAIAALTSTFAAAVSYEGPASPLMYS
jgi:hypothetical protein